MCLQCYMGQTELTGVLLHGVDGVGYVEPLWFDFLMVIIDLRWKPLGSTMEPLGKSSLKPLGISEEIPQRILLGIFHGIP